MKRLISILLAFVLLLTAILPVQAKEVLPIIFVTGIGQTWTHILNTDGSFRSNDPNDKKTYNYFWDDDDPIDYNLLYPDTNGLKTPKAMAASVTVVTQLLLSALLDCDLVSKRAVQTVLTAVLHEHILDENGKLPAEVEDVYKPYPLSEYNETELDDFYTSIPCKDLAEQIGMENVYCFNHPAFSYLYDDAERLHAFIQTVKEQRHTDKVILVPMSMGAAVVSAYLDLYPDTDEVRRVVSIVGAWNGSDVVADLIEGKYSDNAPQLLYHDILQGLDSPDKEIVSLVLRLFPKRVLRSIIDKVVAALRDGLLLKTPSLMALVPYERYEAIEQTYMKGKEFDNVRAQTRRYYEAQRTLWSRLRAQQQRGMEFFFLAGYGLPFGAADFPYFAFMQSTETTNSDEVIAISSTVPGAEYAPCGSRLGRTGEYVSPDGSVDLAASFAPDRTWCFYRQKHGLEYNNTALRLAMDIATGKVRDVQSSRDTYPQFNNARNARSLLRGDLENLRGYIDLHADDAAFAQDVRRAQKMVEQCEAMLADTHNDPDRDNGITQDARQLLYDLGVYEEEEPKTLSRREQMIVKWSERAEKIFGNAGFADLWLRLFRVFL